MIELVTYVLKGGCAGPPRGGAMTLEPMGFRGAHHEVVGFRGPSIELMEMTLRYQHVKTEDLFFFFFFGDNLISTRKTVRISVKTFFLGDHNLDKTGVFSPSVLGFAKPEIRHI